MTQREYIKYAIEQVNNPVSKDKLTVQTYVYMDNGQIILEPEVYVEFNCFVNYPLCKECDKKFVSKKDLETHYHYVHKRKILIEKYKK